MIIARLKWFVGNAWNISQDDLLQKILYVQLFLRSQQLLVYFFKLINSRCILFHNVTENFVVLLSILQYFICLFSSKTKERLHIYYTS